MRVIARACIALACLLASSGATPAIAGDTANGEKVFASCKTCHQIGETAKNMVGRVLNGVIGRSAGTYPGYNYSEANKGSGLIFDEATFREYIKDPKAKIPGTKKTFAGVKDDAKIDDLIAYLKQFGPDGRKVQ
jgi:cytochrome c